MNVEAGMSPAHKEWLAKRRDQDMAERSVEPETNGEAEPDADGSETELMTVDEFMIQRDDGGDILPIEVPFLSDMQATQDKTRTIQIKPWTAKEGREYQIRAYEVQQQFENGELDRKSSYLFDDGELVAYYMSGGQDGEPWCIPTDLLLDWVNDHLIKPEFPRYRRFCEMEEDIPETLMSGLYITMRVYGPGVTASNGDEDIEVLTDKKK